MKCFKDLENGMYIDIPEIFVSWDLSKNDILSLSDCFELINDSYYTLKVNLVDIPFISDLGFHFTEDKLSKIEMFSKNIDTSFNIIDSYDNHQVILESYIGKATNQSRINDLFRSKETNEKTSKWRFKNVMLIHKLWDRFGLEEVLEIKIK